MVRADGLPQAVAMQLIAVPVAGEVKCGDSLLEILLTAMSRQGITLQQGDILVVKHKVVSKAEGHMVALGEIKPSAATKRWSKARGLDARTVELALREAKSVL